MPSHWLDELAWKANQQSLKEIEAEQRRRDRKQGKLRRNKRVVRLLKRQGLH